MAVALRQLNPIKRGHKVFKFLFLAPQLFNIKAKRVFVLPQLVRNLIEEVKDEWNELKDEWNERQSKLKTVGLSSIERT